MLRISDWEIGWISWIHDFQWPSQNVVPADSKEILWPNWKADNLINVWNERQKIQSACIFERKQKSNSSYFQNMECSVCSSHYGVNRLMLCLNGAEHIFREKSQNNCPVCPQGSISIKNKFFSGNKPVFTA